MKNPLIQEQNLYQSYLAYKKNNPQARAVDIAQNMGISEAELLSCRVGYGATRLNNNFRGLLKNLEHLGRVMCLTRNQYCVAEKKGIYSNVSFEEGAHNIGLVVNADIDLRLFMNIWQYGFALEENVASGLRHSFQFFDKNGQAVHKIYLEEEKNLWYFIKLTNEFIHEEQNEKLEIAKIKPNKVLQPSPMINLSSFCKSWENLKDTHDFFPMLKKFKLDRLQALKLIGNNWAYKVPVNAPQNILEMARNQRCEIMIFVANNGCLQIHTGLVKNLKTMGEWYNILDEDFNLHLKTDGIDQCWVVKKPTIDGLVTSLEVFDQNRNLIIQIFGKRKPGLRELKLWREIISKINLNS
jgi:putative hemin transport protein